MRAKRILKVHRTFDRIHGSSDLDSAMIALGLEILMQIVQPVRFGGSLNLRIHRIVVAVVFVWSGSEVGGV
jgi:hypothetical protein